MKNRMGMLQRAGVFALFLLISFFQLSAQRAVNRRLPLDSTRVRDLKKLSDQLNQEYKRTRKASNRLAKKNNWVVQKTYPNGRTISLQGIDALGQPIYYTTHSNAKAAATTRTSQLYANGSLGLNLSGNSSAIKNKLGTWDGGKVRASHQELTGRVTQQDSPSTTDDHATHTSGTMIATGINPIAKGMAFQANLLAWDYNNDASEMATAASNGLLTSNHSYGTIAGWYYDSDRAGTSSDPNWEWWGDTTVSKTEDYKFGLYTSSVRSYDQLTYNAPYYLPVFSAGNNRGETGPAVGQPYYQRSASGNFTRIGARLASLSANDGYDIIAGAQVAKNVLTVGAIEGISEYNQAADVKMSSFSSWGPTDDGRIKPDLVGDGVDLTSSIATSDNAYATYSGTSMATPNVTGTLLLLQEHYANLHSNLSGNNQFMRAATLKGLVIHTADEAGTHPGPDYQYGWGLLNAAKAATVITSADGSHVLTERTLAQGETYTLPIVASGKGPLIATICWTDPAGTALSATKANLNNRTPRLVNDLDIRISDGAGITLPWTLNPSQPAGAATRGDNVRDNVEQILISNAVAGKPYTLTISHKGTLSGGTAQTYALIISGIGGKSYCTSAATTSEGARVNRVSIGSIDTTFAVGCSSYRDVTNRSTDVFPGQQLDLRLTLGSCSGNTSKIAKVFIDWNGDQDFDDAQELVATSGIVTATGDFQSTLSVPTGVIIGNSTRMRVVCVETTNAAEVVACGDYERGETQDYRLHFIRPLTDVGITALVSPQEEVCGGTNYQSVAIKIKNFGSVGQANIPVAVYINKGEQVIATFSTTIKDTLAAFSERTLTISGKAFTLLSGETYTLVAETDLATDVDDSNNQSVTNLRIPTPPIPTNLSATRCNGYLTLNGTGAGSLYWYTTADAKVPWAIGNAVNATASAGNTTYYAALNDFSGSVGPTTKTFATDGGYNQFGPDVLIKTYVPLVLDSARLYVGHAGKITLTVKNTATQAEITSVTLDVVATRSPAVEYNTTTGASAANDPNDSGKVYALGLTIPTAGDYSISIGYADGATIFRNNSGVKGYPFQIANIIAITGNTADATGGVPTDYYYYLYNLKVKAAGCAGTRVAVVADTTSEVSATITAPDTVLCGSDTSVLLTANTTKASAYQWLKNGEAIPNATGTTYLAEASGSYAVEASNGKCTTTSSAVAVVNYSEPILSLANTTLASSVGSGNQWFFEGKAISGATMATYSATTSGKYALQSTQGKCTFLSNEVNVIVPGKEGNGNDQEVKIFPNPTSGAFTLEYLLPATSSLLTIAVYDAQGKIILTRTLDAEQQNARQQFRLDHLAAGMYLVKVSNGNTLFVRKLVKE